MRLFGFAIFLASVALDASSCGPAAATTYTGQHASCIDRAKTREEAEQCIADRDREWCVVDGAPNQCADGGQ